MFTLAGSLDYARAAIDECERAIDELDFTDAKTVTLDRIQNTIKSTLTKFYRRHIYPQGEDREDFQLLVGLWLWGKTRILSTRGTTVREVSGGFQCLGAGAYLAQHYIRQFMPTGEQFNRNNITLNEVRLIAEWALETVMGYDESCGGEAQYMVLQHNGEIGDLSGPVWIRSDLVRELQSATWGFLRKLSLVGDRDNVQLAVEAFERDVRSIGESHVGWWEHIDSIRKTRQGD